jgi:hypothetical protein
MASGGITPFMDPESMTAIVEVRVIEGITMAGVHDELRSALDGADGARDTHPARLRLLIPSRSHAASRGLAIVTW